MTFADVMEAKFTEEVGLEADRRRTPTPTARPSRRTRRATRPSRTSSGKGRRLEVLSIIKRRGSLGLLAHSDEEERLTRTKSEIEAGIAISLGGLVAEEMCLGESGTGPGGDLATATSLAAQMVGVVRDGGIADQLRGRQRRAALPLEPRREGARERRDEAEASRTSSRPSGSGSRRARGEPRRTRGARATR